jgi:DNA-directed RNA polymerase subunit RPC12/RpoP
MDRRRSLSINTESRYYTCFRCGSKGFIKKVPKWAKDAAQAVEHKIELPTDWMPIAEAPGLDALMFEPARRYLAKRKITKSVARSAKVGACAQGNLCGRIVVPVLATDGETWLGYSARDWTNTAMLRYRYPKGMHRAEMVYNHAALIEETDEFVLAVEGVFDALPYWPRAIAFLGKPSRWQVEALMRTSRPIVVVLDGDAHHEGWALAEQLKLFDKRAVAIRLPPKTDPGDIDHGWLLEESRRGLECV